MSTSKCFALPPKPLSYSPASTPLPDPGRSSTGILSGGTRLGGPITPAPIAFASSLPSPIPHQPGISGANDVEELDRSVSMASAPSTTRRTGSGQDQAVKSVEKGDGGGKKEGTNASLDERATEVVTHPGPKEDMPSLTSLGKRKASDETPPRLSSIPPIRSDRAASTFSTMTADTKPTLPVPMLPLPLPSKRFKKSASSKAVLIPVEQLPVYPLPPLPPIRDASLAKQVFIHSSCFPKTRSKFEDAPDRPTEHYEKLEHVGDSILGMVVTTWLHEVKPGLSCGTASKLKAHLVSNATLSHISGMYNFPQRLQGDPHILPVLRAQTDVRAAMVEAYIAALYFSFPIEQRLEEGIRVIDAWLREMYEPLYDFFYDYMNEYEQHHLTLSSTLSGGSHLYTEDEIAQIDASSQGMANLLKMYCYRQDRELHFEEERYETHCGILWRLKCLVDGIEVGEATRSGRKVAKNVAAWEACRRLGLVKDESGAGAERSVEAIVELGEEALMEEEGPQ